MWVLAINGLVYLALGIATGRFRRKLFPIRPSEFLSDTLAALRGKLTHDDLSVYNAVQKTLYLGVILAAIVVVLSGLSIWKPVQFQELTAFFGGYDTARYVHFFAMSAIVGFLVVHIARRPARSKKHPRHGAGPIGEAMRKRHIIPGVDAKLLIKDAAKLLPDPARRTFLRGAASLGALTLLTGCDIVDGNAAEGVFAKDIHFQ